MAGGTDNKEAIQGCEEAEVAVGLRVWRGCLIGPCIWESKEWGFEDGECGREIASCLVNEAFEILEEERDRFELCIRKNC